MNWNKLHEIVDCDALEGFKEYDRQHFVDCHGKHFHYIGSDGKEMTRVDMPSIIVVPPNYPYQSEAEQPKRCECGSRYSEIKSINNATWYDYLRFQGYPIPDYCCYCGLPLAKKE